MMRYPALALTRVGTSTVSPQWSSERRNCWSATPVSHPGPDRPSPASGSAATAERARWRRPCAVRSRRSPPTRPPSLHRAPANYPPRQSARLMQWRRARKRAPHRPRRPHRVLPRAIRPGAGQAGDLAAWAPSLGDRRSLPDMTLLPPVRGRTGDMSRAGLCRLAAGTNERAVGLTQWFLDRYNLYRL
jgi:hypothetical protein